MAADADDERPATTSPLVHYQLTTNNIPQRQCARELAGALPEEYVASISQGNHGVKCRAPASLAQQLSTLTLPERVYAIVLEVPASELPDDESLVPTLKSLVTSAADWPAALKVHEQLHPRAPATTFAVKGERRGRRFKQAVSSLELGGALGAALHNHFGWRVDLREPVLEVTASLNDDSFFVSVALLRRLDSIECRTAGGLHPHVAWAMVRSAGPLPPGGLICDPMCGAGSILLEALEADASCRAIGLDSDVAQLAAARANRDAVPRAIGTRMALLRGDAAALPLRRCDAVVVDWPFEAQHHLDASRGASFYACVREWARLLNPSSRAVMLVSEAQCPSLLEALCGSGLRVLHQRLCPLGFTRAVIVVTERVTMDAGGGDLLGSEEAHVDVRAKSRLPWEGAGKRAEWAVLKKAERAPMVPWWQPPASPSAISAAAQRAAALPIEPPARTSAKSAVIGLV